jgi:tetratricopeptide (TPR) repeat protein
MKARHLLLALAAGAMSIGLAAQDGDRVPHPVPPPPIMIAPPPAPIRTDPELWEYRQSCGDNQASIPFGGPSGRAVFITDSEGPARLVLCNDLASTGVPTDINSLDLALAFMAYKPFKPFWKAAEERWGNDLGKLRDELHDAALAMTAEGNTYQGMIAGSTARAINKAHTLAALGYYAEAQQQLDRALERLGPRSQDTDKYDFDLSLLAITAAGIQTKNIGPEAASTLLEKFSRTGGAGEDTINLDINRAAYLAESGRFQEALDLLLPAYDSFRQGEVQDGTYRISGSDREFSWILACAYGGLGDVRRSSEYRAIVETADESPADPYLKNTKRSTDIRFRMTLCMNDQTGYFGVWRSITEPFLSYNWLAFQKAGGMIWVGGIRRDWVPGHRDARRIARDYRQLPARYTPALHRWQDAPKSGN